MKNYKLLGFLLRSVMMGMIAALFLFTFFPQIITPVVEVKNESQQTDSPMSFASAIRKASPSVVNIRTFLPDPESKNTQPTARIGVGSGVIISAQGYIVTNYHVIYKAKDIAVELTDGRSSIAKVIGHDADTDLAVLKVSMSDLPAITMNSDVSVQVGDIALVIGNPFGVGQAVTMGIVSATGRHFLGLSEYEDFIQTDAAVNPGNSGGALINTSGELLGVSSAYFTRGTKTGISYAIPTSLAMNVIKQIIFNGRVIRGWLGFSGGPINKAGRDDFGKDVYLVTGVSPGSPAEMAGLKEKDVILRVNEKSLQSNIELQNMIAESPPGSEIIIEVSRNHQTINLIAVVQERPQPGVTQG